MATSRAVRGNWLKGYQEYTSESESPDSFHLWTGLSVLASAVRRKVWLNQGIYLLYPNLYVFLVGPPGRVAKSTTIRLGRRLLLGVQDVIFGPDSLTREELIRQMAKAGAKNKDSAMTIHSTELSSLIEPSGIHMVQFLTDIYDGDFKWRYSTKGQGRDTINNPILNILAGTTPSWIAEGLPADVVGHGFTSRVIFVYEEEPRFLKPFPKEPDRRLVELLIEDLNHISNLSGEFVLSDDARKLYIDFYNQIDSTIPSDYRIEGFHWRKRIHILKIAMLLSIAERDDLIIEGRDIQTAWDLLGVTEKKMARTFSAVGKYEHATDLERILANIRQSGGMTVSEIFRRNMAVGDLRTVQGMLQMLVRMKKIKLVKEGTEEQKYVPT